MLPQPTSLFDAIRHEDEQGEWWSARELAQLLAYSKWQSFQEVIDKATLAATNSGESPDHHFTDFRKVMKGGKHGHHTVQDVRLTRYACYLVAQNADPTKTIVAQAQSYFAVKTREAELTDADNELFAGDPEEWLERAIRSYMARGYSEAYARNRVDSILARNRLTGQWVLRGI